MSDDTNPPDRKYEMPNFKATTPDESRFQHTLDKDKFEKLIDKTNFFAILKQNPYSVAQAQKDEIDVTGYLAMHKDGTLPFKIAKIEGNNVFAENNPSPTPAQDTFLDHDPTGWLTNGPLNTLLEKYPDTFIGPPKPSQFMDRHQLQKLGYYGAYRPKHIPANHPWLKDLKLELNQD